MQASSTIATPGDATLSWRALAAVLCAVLIFAGEAVTLRTAAKYQLPTAVIAISQCAVAGMVQFCFGARFHKIDWRRWWPAILTSTINGLAFYLAIRIAPAALVGLIEPLGLVPLMLGHRFILSKQLTLAGALSLVLLIVACVATVGEWPERISLLAIAISSIGIICSGLALVTGEYVPTDGVPSFVLAMQLILMIFSAIMGFGLSSSALAGAAGNWHKGVLVGVSTGLFVGIAVSLIYYGVQQIGALRAGAIRIMRLPTIALLAFLVINERATFKSAIALAAVVIFATLAARFSNNSVREFNN